MKKIRSILDKLNLSFDTLEKIGNCYIIGTNKGKYVFKKNNYINKDKLFDYLDSRGFSFYLKPIYSDLDYDVYSYIEQSIITSSEKYCDMVNIISFLHTRTTHYRNINISKIKDKYDDLKEQIISLKEYFYKVQDSIEEKEIMSPSEYLLIRNISFFYLCLNECSNYLEEWYKFIIDNNSERVVTLHNNLKDSHLLVGKNSYLICWEKTFCSWPIYDLYNLFLNCYNICDYESLFIIYNEKYPLFKVEILFLFVLLLLPKKIIKNSNEVVQCQIIREHINMLQIARKFILNYRSKQKEEESP